MNYIKHYFTSFEINFWYFFLYCTNLIPIEYSVEINEQVRSIHADDGIWFMLLS